MERSLAPWRRFWVPPDRNVRLDSDGFLIDPETSWGRDLNPDLRRVDLGADPSFLVLLGEPGTGKSATFVAERQSIEASLAEVGQ